MHIAVIGQEDLQKQRTRREGDREADLAPAEEQLCRRAHGGQIGADVDRIGYQQQADDDMHQPARQHMRHIGGQPFAGDPADPGADRLDRGHEGIGQDRHPDQAEAELGPDLGVGGDAAGIVVRRPGDQARTQPGEQGLAFGVRRFCGHGRPFPADVLNG